MSIPPPDRIIASPGFQDLSFQKKKDFIDQWALDIRQAAEALELDEADRIAFHTAVDKDIDKWRNQLEEDGEPTTEMLGRIAWSFGKSLISSAPAVAGLAEDASRKIGSAGLPEVDQETRNVEAAVRGVGTFSHRAVRWIASKVESLHGFDDSGQKEALNKYDNQIKEFESLLKDRSETTNLTTEEFTERIESHLNEIRFTSKVLVGNDFEDTMKYLPVNPEERENFQDLRPSALNKESFALIKEYIDTRNPQYLEALYRGYATTKKEEELERIEQESGGIVRGATKAVASIFGEKFAKEIDETTMGLTSDPIDLASVLFVGLRGVQAAKASSLGLKAKSLAAGAAAESAQEAASAIGSGEDPVVAAKEGAIGGLMMGGGVMAGTSLVDSFKAKLKARAQKALDDFDIAPTVGQETEIGTQDNEEPDAGLLGDDEPTGFDALTNDTEAKYATNVEASPEVTQEAVDANKAAVDTLSPVPTGIDALEGNIAPRRDTRALSRLTPDVEAVKPGEHPITNLRKLTGKVERDIDDLSPVPYVDPEEMLAKLTPVEAKAKMADASPEYRSSLIDQLSSIGPVDLIDDLTKHPDLIDYLTPVEGADLLSRLTSPEARNALIDNLTSIKKPNLIDRLTDHPEMVDMLTPVESAALVERLKGRIEEAPAKLKGHLNEAAASNKNRDVIKREQGSTIIFGEIADAIVKGVRNATDLVSSLAKKGYTIAKDVAQSVLDHINRAVSDESGSIINPLGGKGKKAIIWDRKKGKGQVPFQVDIKYFGFTKSMTPDEFRSLVPAGVSGEKTVQLLKDSDQRISPPFLQVEWDESNKQWIVNDHEGRSRSDYAKLVGATSIPVDFLPMGGIRARSITPEMANAPIIPQNGKEAIDVGKVVETGWDGSDSSKSSQSDQEAIVEHLESLPKEVKDHLNEASNKNIVSEKSDPVVVARHAELEAKHKAGTITPEETAEAERMVVEAAKAAGHSAGWYEGGNGNIEDSILDDRYQQRGNIKGPFLTESKRGAWFYATHGGIGERVSKKERARQLPDREPRLSKFVVSYKNPFTGENIDNAALKKAIIKIRGKNAVDDFLSSDFDYAGSDTEAFGDNEGMIRVFADWEVGAEYLRAKKHDAVIYRDAEIGNALGLSKDDYPRTIAGLKPNQIKSADPFTGVPLDQRFDTGPDIRGKKVKDHLNEQGSTIIFGEIANAIVDGVKSAAELVSRLAAKGYEISKDIAQAILDHLKRSFKDERGSINPKGKKGFTTAKGSKYVIEDDGATSRDKAARNDPGHEGDSGKKKRSAKTIYIDSNSAALSAAGLQNLGSKGARVIIKDGKASLITWNEKAGRWGVSPSSKDISFSTEPKVGSYPLELWDKTDDIPGYESYSNMHAGNQIVSITQPAKPKPKSDPPVTAVNAKRAEVKKSLPEAKTGNDIALNKTISGISTSRLTDKQIIHLNGLLDFVKSNKMDSTNIKAVLPDLQELEKLSKEQSPRDSNSSPQANAKYAEAIADLDTFTRNIVPGLPDIFQEIAIDAVRHLKSIDTQGMSVKKLDNHTAAIRAFTEGDLSKLGKYAVDQRTKDSIKLIAAEGGFDKFALGNPKAGNIWGMTANMPSRIRAIFATPNSQKLHERTHGEFHSGESRYDRRYLDARDRTENFFKKYKFTPEENSRAYIAGLLTQWDEGSPPIESFNKIFNDSKKGINAMLASDRFEIQGIGAFNQKMFDSITKDLSPDMTAFEWEKDIYSKLSPKEKRLLDFMRKESSVALNELEFAVKNIQGKEFKGVKNYIHRDANIINPVSTLTDLESDVIDYRTPVHGEKSKAQLGAESGVQTARTGLGDGQYYNFDGLSSMLNGSRKAYYIIETSFGRKLIKNIHLNEEYRNGVGQRRIDELDKVYKSIHSSHLGDRAGSTLTQAFIHQLASNLSALKLASLKNLVAQGTAVLEGITRLGVAGNIAWLKSISLIGDTQFEALIHDLAPQVKERLRTGNVDFDRVSKGSIVAQWSRAIKANGQNDLKSVAYRIGLTTAEYLDMGFTPVRNLSRFVNLVPEALTLKTMWSAKYITELQKKGIIKDISEFDPSQHRDQSAANTALRFAESMLGNPTSLAMRAELFKSNSTNRQVLANALFKFTTSMNGLAHEQANDSVNIVRGSYLLATGRGSKDVAQMVKDSTLASLGRTIQIAAFSYITATISSMLTSNFLVSLYLDDDDLDSEEQRIVRNAVRLSKELKTADQQQWQNIHLELARLYMPLFNNSIGEAILTYGYDKTIGVIAEDAEKKLVDSLKAERKQVKELVDNGELPESKLDEIDSSLELHRALRDRKAFYITPDAPLDNYGVYGFIWDYVAKNPSLEALDPGELSDTGLVRALKLANGLGVTNPDLERNRRLARKVEKEISESRKKAKEKEEQ